MSNLKVKGAGAGLSEAKRKLLAALLSEEGIGLSQSIPPHPAAGAAPLSFSQQRLWFIHQVDPHSPVYNIPGAVHLAGRLDVAALERSLGELGRRHEVLRTTFAMQADEPVQIINPPQTFVLPVSDLSDLTAEEREAAVRRLAKEEATRPFDLAHGPLMRASLLRLGSQEHIVLFTVHHIASDAWSMGVLVRELGELYKAFSSGRPSPLAELPVQYADYACWQRQRLQGELLESHLDYWKKQLGGELTVLQLPLSRPRPAQQTFRAAGQGVRLSPQLTESLKALSQQEGTTLFMTLLAALQTLLHRYTGQHDILVGTPVANRDRAEVEGLIGPFINTLVLRTDTSGDPTCRELLRRVRSVTLDAYRHQELPFDMLVTALQPERNLSHMPLFQVAFSLQNVPAASFEVPGLSLRPVNFGSGSMPYDLNLNMFETPQGLVGGLDYNTDIFDAATVSRLAEHFQTLLAGLAADPNSRLSQLPLLGARERQQQLVEWNDTRREFPQSGPLHQMFERQAASAPDATALIFEGERLTYRELNERANQLARHLRTLGVGRESLVGILMERSAEMVVALLAVLKAGGAYVPLDPQYPQERLSFMLADSGARVLLTQSHLASLIPRETLDESLRVVSLDAVSRQVERQATQNIPDSGVTDDNLAYVIYTSGSTGRPKGVCVAHRSIANRLLWMIDAFDFDSHDRTLQKTSISFDASVWELFVPLISGGSLVVARPGGHQETRYLLDVVAAQHVTTLQLVPSMLRVVLAESGVSEKWGGLRRMFCGGEALASDLAARFRQEVSQARLCNLYGPTEASIDATAWPLQGDEPGEGVVTLGRPIANMEVYVLDGRQQVVPAGVPGEIYLGGVGLARAYLNRAELTAERFVPHAFSGEAGARLYRTGDVGKWGLDGKLHYLGRADAQVKVRGYRIELGEVEAALREHPGVSEAVVVVREDEAAQPRLVGYVVPNQDSQADQRELRDHLAERLPEYMIPSAFVSLDEMPLTSNGKIDRKALPAPGRAKAEGGQGAKSPMSPVEEVLAGIWGEVLGLGQVGVHENFFELGGHSLLALQVGSRVRKAFQVELSVRRIFESPTVAQMAQIIEAEMRKGGLQSPPVTRVPRDGGLPLSFAQQRLWFLSQLGLSGAAYNMPTAVRLGGDVNVAALEQSIGAVIRRHESLRTRFELANGQPVQFVNPPARFELAVEDLRHLPDAELEAETRRRAAAEAAREFDLSRGELLRAKLLRTAEQEYVLLLTIHHIASDGWSSGVLLKELTAFYQAYASGGEPPFTELPVQYADYAAWQRGWLQGEVLEAQLAYWAERLKGAPTLNLPTDRPRSEALGSRGGRETLALSRHLTESLNLLSRREGVTLFMTILAAFDVLLAHACDQEDVVVGTDVANRDRAETEGMIGFFVNQLVLRTDLSGDPTFRELLGRVREVTLGAYAHQDMPFDKLVEELNPERSLSIAPLFQVKIVHQNMPQAKLEIPGLRLSPVGFEGTTAKADLTLELVEAEERLIGGVNYRAELFDPQTVARMLRHFEIILAQVAERPEIRLHELRAVLAADEQRQQRLREREIEQTSLQRLQSIRRKPARVS
ncbi:MAG TPA: amino acid adenylation domain-containing protein [Pyrinomonadaceae bacterium]|nr:amino acid adenylation domain-containing protein [Pyrinomonadaceae bacterium]